MSTTTSPPIDKHPLACFQKAEAYHVAADKLLSVMDAERLPVRDLVLFLYHHAVELALKACLFAHGHSAPRRKKGQDIVELLARCKDRKLLSLPVEVSGIMATLHSGDEDDNRYRYDWFNLHVAKAIAEIRRGSGLDAD